MARCGYLFIAVGLMIALGCVGWLAWMTTFWPDINDPFAGFLSTAGMWFGAVIAGVGAVIVAKGQGRWTPPL